ncbi:serine/threonine-protein kinase pim-1-like [Centroberyx affinis]|uniref:serine/threonine-protein kinase pim-1-like n=1 Tax=Centroberyx affinis TaxID=166261 RepID=UPI003A5BAAD1
MASRSMHAFETLDSLGSKRDQGSPAATDSDPLAEDGGAERKRRRSKRKASSGKSREQASKRLRGATGSPRSPAASQDPSSVNTGRTNEKTLFNVRYEEVGPIGKGSYGSVYSGYRRMDRLPVAIKHIAKPDVVYKKLILGGRVRQVPLEVVLLLKAGAGAAPGAVGGTAAVTLVDWFDPSDELVLVLERPVPSMDLVAYLEARGGRIQEREAKIIMKQLVDAAVEIEAKGVFHRDVKLENVLVETGSDVPRVRLIDFGLGRVMRERAYTQASGTPAYTPPEWYQQGSYTAGPTTVWQLGVLMFGLLAGRLPFDTERQTVHKKAKLGNGFSRNCQDFVRRCLTRCTDRRFTLEHLQLHPWLD